MKEWQQLIQIMELRLQQALFYQQEIADPHCSYEDELRILDFVWRGIYQNIEQVLQHSPTRGRIGTMSEDEYQQKMYEFITWTTMVTRFAIEGGLETESAYTLSDLYIQQADTTKNLVVLEQLRHQMTWHFAYKVSQKQNAGNGYSKPVSKAVDHLINHLYQTIQSRQ